VPFLAQPDEGCQQNHRNYAFRSLHNRKLTKGQRCHDNALHYLPPSCIEQDMHPIAMVYATQALS
jgi:hypothetical protein